MLRGHTVRVDTRAAIRTQGQVKASSSFLKKRTKKLLPVGPCSARLLDR
jgi:hypothetical protein